MTMTEFFRIHQKKFTKDFLKNTEFRLKPLTEDAINHAEDDFYSPEVLEKSQSILYVKPVIQKTLKHYGPERNFILTSRNSEFKDVTLNWFECKFPEIKPENILIRSNG
ncbi:MAG: hypothetical protein UT96_C0021G0008 [Candidatus Woesebacteria bacterium GW2011_GWC2_40_30]|nr:MAG: hypothetical protein UT96_C0021G0008 [Candidatus Woesebacteria bacterium GW2011_GWC2_40_30]